MISMRHSFLLVALWSATMSVGRAGEHTEYTNGPDIPGSSIGFSISIAGLDTVVVDPTSTSPGSHLVVDQNLDASNSGSLAVTGGEIRQQDFLPTGQMIRGFIGSVKFAGNGLKYTVTLGSTALTSGNLSVNSSTPGSVTLSGGTLQMSGTILGKDMTSTLDLNAHPLTFLFGDLGKTWSGNLGASSLTGYADGNAAGASDGAEFLLDLTGLTAETAILVPSINTTDPLPLYIQLNGSVYVSVPEVSSAAMIGASVLGLGIIASRRRQA